TAPSTITSSAGYTVTSTVTTATTEPSGVQAVNTVSLTTTAANQPPLASNVVNSLQTPEANTGQQLLISPLLATDPDGSVASYALTSLPTSGKLYYNNGGTYTEIVAANLLSGTSPLYLTPTQAQTLKYTPAAGFAGNAFFGYVATDNGAVPLTSNQALYTIPVGADNASVYAKTPVKASASAYAAGDIIAFVTDNNGALYNTSAVVYDASTGALQSNTANGVASAASTGTFTSSQYASITNLSQLGLVLDNTTGQLRVQTPANLRPGTYTLPITTTDLYGGVTTQSVTFTIGGTPLPVTLVAFTAVAVQNRDAQLNWTTASEVNNDHFEVERSFDGTTFAQIGRVAGHGTTSAAAAYTLTDAAVAAKASGPVYYRLRQVDYNGTATYSPVRSVSFSPAARVSLGLYPNPAQASTQLDLSQLPTANTYQVQLLDATGRTVGQWTLSGGQVQALDVHALATGAYLLRVSGQQPDGATLQQTLRLTKD
ncbi:MAG: T9SS type A sorting domain-containing protein, partial [Hymenobacter sp.]